MTVVWDVVAMAVGVLIAAQLVWPGLNEIWAPYTGFGRLRPLHTNAVIFAFGGCALFATSYYVVQRTSQAPLFGGWLVPFTFWGWQAVFVLAPFPLRLVMLPQKEYVRLGGPFGLRWPSCGGA